MSTQPSGLGVVPISLKTHDGRLVNVRRGDDGTVIFGVGAGDPAKFGMVLFGEDRVALRMPDSLEHVIVNDTGEFIAVQGSVGPRGTFQLVLDGEPGWVGFRHVATNRHLSVAPGTGELRAIESALGPSERFTFDPSAWAPEGGAHAHRGCCGPHGGGASPGSDPVGVVWDEYTHFRTLEVAVHVMQHMKDPTDEARFVVDVYQGGGAAPIREGLAGADTWLEWVTYHWFPFHYHFYDPNSGQSYPGRVEWGNALTKGRDTFEESVQLFRSNRRESLVKLGLSLHFLTDLCQPMHAANFINFAGGLNDWRHGGFEGYAEDFTKNRDFFRQTSGQYPPLAREEILVEDRPQPGPWLDGVARQANATWKRRLEKIVQGKEIQRWGRFGPYWVYDNTWTPAQADETLMESLWLAPRNTARYLAMWARRVTRA